MFGMIGGTVYTYKHMNFINRTMAGEQLAETLSRYRFVSTMAIAVDEASLLVAREVAAVLHSGLLLLVQSGEQPASLEEASGSDKKRVFSVQNEQYLLGDSGKIDQRLLRHQTVMIVADSARKQTEIERVRRLLKALKLQETMLVAPAGDTSYDDDRLPEQRALRAMLRQNCLYWR